MHVQRLSGSLSLRLLLARLCCNLPIGEAQLALVCSLLTCWRGDTDFGSARSYRVVWKLQLAQRDREGEEKREKQPRVTPCPSDRFKIDEAASSAAAPAAVDSRFNPSLLTRKALTDRELELALPCQSASLRACSPKSPPALKMQAKLQTDTAGRSFRLRVKIAKARDRG